MKRWILASMLLLPLGAAGETLLGAGVRHRPVFEGAGRETTDLIPVLRYYGSPWFARTTQGILEGGARARVREGLDAGVQLAYEQGPRDGDPGASLGAHLELERTIGPAPLNLLARVRQHLDAERGAQADLRATLGVYGARGFAAGVFAQATWASEKHLEAYYGVRDSGLLFTSLGALGSYELGRRWLAAGSVEARRLGAEPARAAIVRDRIGTYFSAGIAYRF